MAFSDEQLKSIREVLAAKGIVVCPACHRTPNWNVVADAVPLSVQPPDTIGTLRAGGPILPSIAIVCANCGNTQLHNILVLGLADVLGLKKPEPAGVK
jgi:hypothetical protein